MNKPDDAQPYPWFAVISFLVIFVGGIGFLVYTSTMQQRELRQAGLAFLEDLREDRLAEAWATMASDIHRSTTRTDFDARPDIVAMRSATRARFSASSVASAGQGCLRGRVVTPASTLPLTLYMTREGDLWRVHTIELDTRISTRDARPFHCSHL